MIGECLVVGMLKCFGFGGVLYCGIDCYEFKVFFVFFVVVLVELDIDDFVCFEGIGFGLYVCYCILVCLVCCFGEDI